MLKANPTTGLVRSLVLLDVVEVELNHVGNKGCSCPKEDRRGQKGVALCQVLIPTLYVAKILSFIMTLMSSESNC
jgi:hypothetical protein